jgi:hypothetical protein
MRVNVGTPLREIRIEERGDITKNKGFPVK